LYHAQPGNLLEIESLEVSSFLNLK
jgi:hypothetical protein